MMAGQSRNSKNLWNQKDSLWTMNSYPDANIAQLQANPAAFEPYYVGYHEIINMKEDAQQALGSRFHEKEFHTALLESGIAPFQVVQQHIDAYVEKNK